jgi:hypothetical protein
MEREKRKEGRKKGRREEEINEGRARTKIRLIARQRSR